ncbi:hypothetical protein ACF1DV_25980 [Streptomyces achromogenes]|uniref:hypothetical protein n=1 Tax=Streptomyces achromogenes TaxID=67255 RepID=UPI0036F679A1
MSDMEAQCAPLLKKLKSEPFATIIPDRRPAVKLHAHIGLAKLAVAWTDSVYSGARGGEIYECTADGWSLLFRVEAGTPTDQLPWRE